MSSPKVLFVSHAGSASGAEMILLDIVPSFPDSAVFLFQDGPLKSACEARGMKVIKARFGAGFSSIKRDSRLLAAAPMAARMLFLTLELSRAARAYDVIYANSQKAFVIGSAASALARRPLIWHLHDILSNEHFGSGQRRLQISLANHLARYVVAPSKAVERAFLTQGGRNDLTRVVPNGIDVDVDPTPRRRLRRALHLPPGPLIGVFSRLSPWKGQHVVLRALANLPGVNCIIAGAALFGEETYLDSLKLMASNLGLSDRVLFLGHRNDVPQLMQAVDLAVHPSIDPEPFGRTLVEAMLVGTPIVATDAGAASEILPANSAAVALVPPGDSHALALSIRRILAAREDLAEPLTHNRECALTNFGVLPMRHRIAEVVSAAAGRLTS